MKTDLSDRSHITDPYERGVADARSYAYETEDLNGAEAMECFGSLTAYAEEDAPPCVTTLASDEARTAAMDSYKRGIASVLTALHD
jgi:hypothetical protein